LKRKNRARNNTEGGKKEMLKKNHWVLNNDKEVEQDKDKC
jgi:hypothetical protein